MFKDPVLQHLHEQLKARKSPSQLLAEAREIGAREEAAAEEQPSWQFKPGQSGNPKGRPKGSKNRATLLAESLLPCGAGLVDQALEAAFAGDPVMLRACLNKLVPAIRRRPIALDLPEDASATDMDALLDATSEALASGNVTPEEACEITVYVKNRIAAKLGVLKARLLEVELAERERRAAEAASKARPAYTPEELAEMAAARDRAIDEMRRKRDGIAARASEAA